MYRVIIPKLHQRAIEYQQWFFDEQNKAEQILKNSGYTLPRIRTRISLWSDDFLDLLKTSNESRQNKENQECYAIDSLTKQKVCFRSNSSQYWEMISSLSIHDYSNLFLLSAMVAKGVNNFCVKQTANSIRKKRQILEPIAENTRKLREDREYRVKQRKKQFEKDDKQRRDQSLRKIKRQALNVAVNKEYKHYELSATPIAKRTRSAHDSTPIAKRVRNKKTDNEVIQQMNIIKQHRQRMKMMKKKTKKKEMFHNETRNHPKVVLENDTNQVLHAKLYPITIMPSELKTAISEISSKEGRLLPKFDCNVSEVKNSSQTLIKIPECENYTEKRYTGIEAAEIAISNDTSQLFMSKKFSKKIDDANIFDVDRSSVAISTASILERTRPCDQSINIMKQSIWMIHQDELYKVDSDMMHNDITKRSICSINNRTKYLTNDDLHVIPMDLKSSSCESKLPVIETGDDIVKDNKEKRGNVTSTRFPGRITLNKLEEQEYTRKLHSTDIKDKIEDETIDDGIYDLSSSDRNNPNDESEKKIPHWAKDEEVCKILEKQRLWSLTDIDSLFGKIHPPDMQKMFDGKIRATTRSSSAMWESPIWNPRVGHSNYHFVHELNQNQDYNIRRSQRVKKPVSYIMYY
ncbi:Inner centromere protein [Dirofilaria immitis]